MSMHPLAGTLASCNATGPNGAFTLPNVPPGDYTIAIWHEKLGEQKQPVHLDASGKAAISFTYR